ncbi:MAG: hypothetical protein AB1564_02590 [Chloroflexota bacterium]
MSAGVNPWRVLVKAILLFSAINVIFAASNPAVGRITLYNRLLPGRLRFPYEQQPMFYDIGYNAPVSEDFDAMFGAHVISAPKPADEYRVILIGDSSTWGTSVQAGDTLAEQINRLDLRTCDGRRVRAYNLGYPLAFLIRDLLVLEKAMDYQPDLALWLITLSTFVPQTAEKEFLAPHAGRYVHLTETYDLSFPHLDGKLRPPSFWERTIFGQRKRLKDIILVQAYGLLWAATGIDNHEGFSFDGAPPNPDVSSDLHFLEFLPEDRLTPYDLLMLESLSGGYGIVEDIPLVLVNEPIFVASGANSDVRYNGFYPRWAYDGFRQVIVEQASDHGYRFLDYWNSIPPDGFADRNIHRNPAGERRFAELLAPEILELSCP